MYEGAARADGGACVGAPQVGRQDNKEGLCHAHYSADIQQKTFPPEARRGYDPAKVDEFLEEISTDIEAMLRKIADLHNRLSTAESKNAELTNQLEAAKAAAAKAQSQAAAAAAAIPTTPAPTGKSSTYAATEEQLSAALIAAQQTAERIVNDAKTNAERIRSDAETQARKVIRQALDEKQAELDEIERLKKSRASSSVASI